jgi:rhamnosyltransferase
MANWEGYRVAAYITAYEDAPALNACLTALQDQTVAIEHIFVVDNSRQPLPLEPQHQANSRLRVWHHPENIGIAAGIQVALEQASIEGYDFLWMFDQDSQPMPTCLEELLKAYESLSDSAIGILGPHAIEARTGVTVEPALFLGDRFEGYKAPSQTDPFECDAPITSGSLLWLKAHPHVKPPDPKLFIDGVDLDYGLRVKQAGFRNFIVPKAVMHHRFGESIVVQFAGKKKIVQIYSPLRHYYICRNHTYLELFYSQGLNRFTCGLRRIKFALRNSITIVLFEPESRLRKLKACMIGTYHGFQGNLNEPWK